MNVLVEILFGAFQERFQSKDPGIVDEHIDAPELTNCYLDHLFARFLVADIPGYQSRPALLAQVERRQQAFSLLAAFKTTLEPLLQEPSSYIVETDPA